MSGFFDAGASGVIGTSVAALVTIAVWSYLAGERRLFAAAQHLLAGLATGYFVLISVREVLVPRLFVPLFGNPDAHPLLWPALLGVLVLIGARWMPRRVAALPIALLIAGTAAFALGGAVVGTLLPQLAASLLPAAASGGGMLNAVIGLLITALVLFTFMHGVRGGRISDGAAGIGRWLLVGGLGGWLGFLLMSRLALLVERLRFLLVDWLGIGR